MVDKMLEGTELFRGVKTPTVENLILTPSGTRRPAANFHSDYYEDIFQNLSSWNGWPDRAESTICTGSVGQAGMYGQVYSLYPVDGATIAACNSNDFWFANFKDQEAVEKFFKIREPYYGRHYASDVYGLMRALYGDGLKSIDNAETMSDLNYILSPENLGFTQFDISEYSMITSEFWTSDKSYGIHTEKHHAFKAFVQEALK